MFWVSYKYLVRQEGKIRKGLFFLANILFDIFTHFLIISIYYLSEWLCIKYDGDLLLAAQEGARSQPCVIIFLFVYFFGNAISTWWTLVAFSWALAQHCSPNKASMHRISMICHMYGWGLPAILTLVALLTHSIEADELTSICLPGMLNVLQSVIFMFAF